MIDLDTVKKSVLPFQLLDQFKSSCGATSEEGGATSTLNPSQTKSPEQLQGLLI
jgi:hypothetical protein